MTETDFTRADRHCDIVMKGGITSGIVYPAAVCRLAREYRFRSIGGTSAGAIAAAATAAAEYGRRAGRPSSFAELEGLPETLAEPMKGGGSRLFHLFRPQKETARLFRTLTAGLRGKRGLRKLVVAALWNYPLFALLGAIPAIALAVWSDDVLAVVPWLLLALVGAAIGIALAVYHDVRVRVPANLFGLTTGMGEGALTPWLHELLQSLSGKPLNDPLTFGDLWGEDPKQKIDLQMMTTSLTLGRPYRLPFAPNEEKRFYFRPKELDRIFPKQVVDFMVAHTRKESEAYKKDELVPLPLGKNLPVLVATRMSLSFPFLISAVPLQAIDFSREGKNLPEPCWFSDGGIASNFPVHFFDAPLPGWPTFAVNLRYYEEEPKQHVVMPRTNRDGIAEAFHRFEHAGLLGFFKAIFDAMQNWRDNTQTRMPGYRDRIVHVSLGPGEGGLNLDMPKEKVTEIAGRGRAAGELLAARFAPESTAELGWTNHRWVRFRSTMACLEEMIEKLGKRLSPEFEPPQPGDDNYWSLLSRETDELPSYKWKSEVLREEAIRVTAQLQELASDWAATAPHLADGAPQPSPELRARPKI